MAKTYGLKSPQPIMCSTRQSGDCMYMFQSGSKYYLWILIAGEIWEIVTPMDLVGIVAEMGKMGFGSLKTVEIHPVSTSG